MTLGDYIKKYRLENGVSQRKFAEMCDGNLTCGYISMLEKNINPKTGKKIAPSIEAYKVVAKATGVSLDELIGFIGSDESVVINAKPITKKQHARIADQLQHLTDAELDDVADYIKFVLSKR